MDIWWSYLFLSNGWNIRYFPLDASHPCVVSAYDFSGNLVVPASTLKLRPITAGLYQAFHDNCVAWIAYVWSGSPEHQTFFLSLFFYFIFLF